jgi:hypothetical protein
MPGIAEVIVKFCEPCENAEIVRMECFDSKTEA